MPLTPSQSFTNQRLDPVYPSGGRGIAVKLAPGAFYPRGTILGQISNAGATKGLFAAYGASHTDGTQVPKLVLAYDVNVDSSGNMTLGGNGQVGGPHGTYSASVFAYFKGEFNLSDLAGLDSSGMTQFARFVTGETADGGVVTLL